nr:hypothetical protein [Tanacetum cinerariifolium]
VPDVPTYGSDDERIYWKSNDEEDDDDETNVSKDKDEDDQEDVDDQDNDDDQGDDDEWTDLDNDGDDFGDNKEETNEEVEANELYGDMNVNLVGRDTEMTDAPCTIIQTTQVIEDTHVIITPVNPDGQQQSSSMSSGFISNMLNPS